MSDRFSAFEMVVGLEVHVQLSTRTKAFCRCANEYGAYPNANTCPVCLALPGTLPVINAQAVRFAVRAALALECSVRERSVFARKNYFYPDLPKGYQISQYEHPLAEHGRLAVSRADGAQPLVVRITRLHLEEDAGKSIHDRYPGVTAVDLNRAGVPLIEIVTEPDLRSTADASMYLHALKQLLEYIEVSDVSMEQGSLRVDANVSARPRGATDLGTKTEVKNMNSFSAVERALELEFTRQTSLLSRGEQVEQQTLLWDGARGEVRPSRTKEGSHDYRYFPEPDLPPLILAPPFIAEVRAELPELPRAKRERFKLKYGLSASPLPFGEGTFGAGRFGIGEGEIDILTSSRALADYFERVVAKHGDPKTAANWVTGEVLAWCRSNAQTVSSCRVTPEDLAALLDLIAEDIVSHTAAKRVFAEMARSGEPPLVIAERERLVQVRDSGALATWVDEVLAENPSEAARFLNGEKKLQGVLVGLVMKKSLGRADPKRVNQLLSERGPRSGA